MSSSAEVAELVDALGSGLSWDSTQWRFKSSLRQLFRERVMQDNSI